MSAPDQKFDSATPAAEATAAEEAAIPAPEPESGGDAGPGTDVAMPQMGESITEGTITKWLKNVGDTVQRDEPIFEISTDKVDAEIPSPMAGTLVEIRVKEGATVTVGTIVAVIGGSGTAAQALAATPARQRRPRRRAARLPRPRRARRRAHRRWYERSPRTTTSTCSRSPVPARAGASPRRTFLVIWRSQRRGSGQPTTPGIAAAAQGVQQSPATGGRSSLRQRDPDPVQASLSAVQSAAATTAPAKAAGGVQQLGELVPMSKMRSIIAKRMVESKHTSPHVHTVFKVDMTRIVKLREKEKNKYEQRNGVKLTFMPFITRAAVAALRMHPVVNAAIQGDAIFYNKNINIGIAVALDWGLIVPVVKQCEEKNFLGVARAIVDLAERARAKKLAPDEVSGGTFTLTNAGIFGEQFGTPIINQPQAAILGIGGLNKEAARAHRQGRPGYDRDPLHPALHAWLRSSHRRRRGRRQVHDRLQELSAELDRRHRLVFCRTQPGGGLIRVRRFFMLGSRPPRSAHTGDPASGPLRTMEQRPSAICACVHTATPVTRTNFRHGVLITSNFTGLTRCLARALSAFFSLPSPWASCRVSACVDTSRTPAATALSTGRVRLRVSLSLYVARFIVYSAAFARSTRSTASSLEAPTALRCPILRPLRGFSFS